MKLYQPMFKSNKDPINNDCCYWPSSCIFKTKKEAKQYAEEQGYNKKEYYINILDLVDKINDEPWLYKDSSMVVYRGRTFIYGED